MDHMKVPVFRYVRIGERVYKGAIPKKLVYEVLNKLTIYTK